ncbi:hypothetical protein LZ31DRAFT_201329 [Colletotrichum somersetense]|nr:hypothetical protein LZ31DRAFT_201329 [Colletotrichum somersetense]
MLHATHIASRQFHLAVGFVFKVSQSLDNTAVVDTDSIVALRNQLPSLLRRFLLVHYSSIRTTTTIARGHSSQSVPAIFTPRLL